MAMNRKSSVIRLVFRTCVFAGCLLLYGLAKVQVTLQRISPMLVLWVLVVLNMLLCAFPGKQISRGSKKQYGRFFAPGTTNQPALRSNTRKNHWRAAMTMAIWLAFNGVFFALYARKIIAESEMILLCAAYYALDMVCVALWCPFRSLFMKNRCCSDCRIYNWDHIFMVTPLAVVPGFWAQSLFWLGVVMFIVWEWNAWRHPERFYAPTNRAISCAGCTERLCGKKAPAAGEQA